MFLLTSFAVGVLVIMLLGGRPGRLADIRLRTTPVVIGCSLATKFVWDSGIYDDNPLLGRGIWVAGFFGVALFLYLNRRYRFLLLSAAGVASNAAVIIANRGRMPSSLWAFDINQQMPTWYRQPGVTFDSIKPHIDVGSTPLWFLGDVIPGVLPMSSVFSIGDVLLTAGAIGFVARAMFGHHAQDDEADASGTDAVPIEQPAPAPSPTPVPAPVPTPRPPAPAPALVLAVECAPTVAPPAPTELIPALASIFEQARVPTPSLEGAPTPVVDAPVPSTAFEPAPTAPSKTPIVVQVPQSANAATRETPRVLLVPELSPQRDDDPDFDPLRELDHVFESLLSRCERSKARLDRQWTTPATTTHVELRRVA